MFISTSSRKEAVRELTMLLFELLADCNLNTGIPIQANFDKGSEVGWEYAIQVALRYVFLIIQIL
jgi:hypothetical protein